MTKTEIEAFLREFDEALVQAFPSVALHIGEPVREVTFRRRIRVVRRCLLCCAVRSTGLL